MQPLKLIFAGTPHFAAHHLQALLDSQHDIVAVYTQPDRPAGRGKKLSASPVKQLALQHDLPIEQPVSLKEATAQQVLADYRADVMIVVAYGLLLPQAVLDTPQYGCLNVHGSILPRWRGAAPIQRAIEAGDSHTGVTIMQMDKGLDTGDMLLKVSCDISPQETSASLHDKLMVLGAPALLETLTLLQQQALQPDVQNDDLACYAEKISKAEACIDWAQATTAIDRAIRAFNPFPVAYTFLQEQRIKIYTASLVEAPKKLSQTDTVAGEIVAFTEQGLDVFCGHGKETAILRITMLQIPGKKAMMVKDLFNGYAESFRVGQQFTSSITST